MEEEMSNLNKFMWTATLVCAIALILMTGQTNKRNYEKVQGSIEGIYADRLVVKGLIYDLVTSLHKKEVALLRSNTDFFSGENKTLNDKMKTHIELFKETELTPKEDETLRKFEKDFNRLVAIESKLTSAEYGFSKNRDYNEIERMLTNLYRGLNQLSEIQLEEGKRKLQKSVGAVKSMNFFERIENYFLIIFSVLILIILFVFPGEKKKENAQESAKA